MRYVGCGTTLIVGLLCPAVGQGRGALPESSVIVSDTESCLRFKLIIKKRISYFLATQDEDGSCKDVDHDSNYFQEFY